MNAAAINAMTMLSQPSSIPQSSGAKEEQGTDFGSLILGKISNDSRDVRNVSDSQVKSDNSGNRNDVNKKAVSVTDDRKVQNRPENISDEAGTGTSEKAQVKSAEADDTENINRDEAAAVLSVLETITQGVAEILGISPEELQSAMDALSMEPADLTDRNNLAQLILSLNNTADISDMLLDNGMYEQLNQLYDFVEGTLSENGLTPEVISDFMETYVEAETSDEIQDTSDGRLIDVEKTDEGPDNSAETGKAASEPKVTVEKQETDEAGEEEAGTEGSSELKTSKPTEKTSTGRISTEHFIQNLEKAADGMMDIDGQAIDVRDIAHQIVEQIKIRISPENTSMEMRLNPDNLGRVAIAITSKNGVMTAEIHTENQSAREAIESQLQILKESIQERGLKVEAIEVRVSDFNFTDSRNSESDASSDGKNANHRNRKADLNGMDGMEDISEAAKSAREILENAGSTVSYRV